MEEKHFGPQISRLHVLLKQNIEHFSQEYGLSSTQSHIMVFLHYETEKREVYQKDIEEEFKIRRSSVSSVLSTMEKNGLVERRSSEHDARLKKLVLTEKGEQIHQAVKEKVAGFDQAFRSVLNEEEMEQFESYIRRLQQYLENCNNKKEEDL